MTAPSRALQVALLSLSGLSSLVAPVSLTAQAAFAPVGKQHLPADLGDLRSGELADLDGDGDLDAALVCGCHVTVLRNVGEGRLERWRSALPSAAIAAHRLLVGDLDGDRDVDLLVVANPQYRRGTAHRLLLNNGAGQFVDGSANRGLPPAGRLVEDALLVDVDGNGSLDLLVASVWVSALQDQLFINNGRGVFSDQTTARLPADLAQTASVAAGDLDGDGDVDLVLGRVGFRMQSQILENLGTGRFRAIASLPIDSLDTHGLAIGDIDGDRDLDLVLANQDYSSSQGVPSAVWRNEGGLRFVDVSATALPTRLAVKAAIALADVDGDRAPELIVSDYTGVEGLLVLGNDGRGRFRVRPGLGLNRREAAGGYSLLAGDVDGDTRMDLLFGGARPQLWLNNGRGGLDHVGGPRRSPSQTVLAFDADRDGDLDLLSTEQLRRNTGAGAFEAFRSPWLPTLPLRPWSGAHGDFDGDGDIDVFLAYEQTGQNVLLRRNARGVYVNDTVSVPVRQDDSLDVVTFDADGDGDLDLFTADSGRDQLLLNDGRGRFVDAPGASTPADSLRSNAVAAGDVDGDGDVDLVIAKGSYTFSDRSDRLWLNDGRGRFVVGSGFPGATSFSTGVVLADFDGDGDLDCVVSAAQRLVGSRFVPDRSRLLRNDGGGRFVDVTSTQWSHAPGDRRNPLVGDFDGDGDVDLLIANRLDQQELWLNDGRARFTAGRLTGVAQLELEGGAIAVGDLDLDGDLDLLTGEGWQRNLEVDLGAPRLAVGGRSYRFEVGYRVGRAPAGARALLFVGASRLGRPIDVPGVGRWLLDPAGAVALPPVVLPQGTGRAQWTFALPFAVPFRAPILAQALVVPPGPGVFRVSPPIVDSVRR